MADKRTAAGTEAEIGSGGKVISVKRLTCHCFCSWPSEHMFGPPPLPPPPPQHPLLSDWNLSPSLLITSAEHTVTHTYTHVHSGQWVCGYSAVVSDKRIKVWRRCVTTLSAGKHQQPETPAPAHGNQDKQQVTMENKLAHALALMGEGSFTHAPEHGVNDIKVHMTTWLWMLLKNKNNLTFDFLSGKVWC